MTRADAISALLTLGKLRNEGEAEAVLVAYLKAKAVRYNAHDGFTFSHGALLDPSVAQAVCREAMGGRIDLRANGGRG